MKRKRFSAEQIVGVLKQTEGEVPEAEATRKARSSEQRFCGRKKQYLGVESDPVREMKQLLSTLTSRPLICPEQALKVALSSRKSGKKFARQASVRVVASEGRLGEGYPAPKFGFDGGVRSIAGTDTEDSKTMKCARRLTWLAAPNLNGAAFMAPEQRHKHAVDYFPPDFGGIRPLLTAKVRSMRSHAQHGAACASRNRSPRRSSRDRPGREAGRFRT